MNEKDIRNPELEDIVKEFSTQKSANDPAQGLNGDTVRLEPVQKAVQDSSINDDTAVFSPVSQQAAVFTPLSQETAVFRPVTQATAEFHPVTEKTAQFQPVGQETTVFQPVDTEAQPLPADGEPQPEAAAAEPFSESWEPEYDQPIGPYTSPISFRPKDRLRQLRVQQISGPEKRYYELLEMGFGKLQASIFLIFVIFALSAASTVLYEVGLIGPERTRLLVFLQLLSLLLSGLLGCYRMMEGLSDISRLRFSLSSLLCISFIVCALDGILCLQSQRISCCALFCLEMLMSQIATYQKRSTQLSQMDILRKASDIEAVVRCEGYMDEKPGFLTAPGQLSSFMDSCDQPAAPEKLLQRFGFASLIVSLGLGIFGYSQGGLAAAVQMTTGALLLSMPATAFLSHTAPMHLVQKRMQKLGSVICGWPGIQAAAGEAVYPLRSEDIFPEGHAKFNGVKFMGSADPDYVVSYAASIVAADGSKLAPLFDRLMRARGARLRSVEDLHDYEGGLSAVVDGAPVCLGDLDFMRQMGVEVPKNTRIPHAVYIAIGTELSGVFAVTYTRSKSSASGLRTLCSVKQLQPVLVSNDFCLTPGLLRKTFQANTDRLLRPERAVRQGMAEVAAPEDASVVALTTRGGLAQRAFTVTSAKALYSAMRVGTWIHMLGGIIGLVAAAVLVWVGGIHLLSPGNLLLYWLLWMIPGWLTTQWTRFL